ncbi:MAG: HAD family hydrolase [Candidatus Woesearchaeota archaeon]
MTKRAVIFDLDGTLVNSIPFHLRIHRKVLSEFGIRFTNEFFETKCNGSKPEEFYKLFFEHYKGTSRGYKTALKRYYKERKSSDIRAIKTFSGVKRMMKRLHDAGYKIAVATSSTHKYAEILLDANNIRQYIHEIVGGNEVEHTKPDPHIFLLARKELGVKKVDCVVVEDAVNGVKAARRAKIDCLCMLTSEKREDIPGYAIVVEKHSQLFDVIENM